MSRIGKQLINIPTEVNVVAENNIVTVTGPKGELKLNLPIKINVEIKDNQVIVTRASEDKKTKANHGTTRAHLNNMIKGVVELWKKELEIRGTGYKVALMGNKIRLNVGFIHHVDVEAPAGVFFEVPEDTKVIVTGTNKTHVGQVASNIRKIRPPEPYKGKGIRYVDEFIKLKAGKKAKA
ncbi:MAG: 50S ribosomal protein L6 [Candidatus Shapirobacteria bacterium]|jgi:large subunit ribosomal protein L6|nr:50S ribosomal protein L6 [Candidatus Shapirobacteria bacterium]